MPSSLRVKRLREDLLTEPIAVVVLGSGGREHALAHKISQSPLCGSVTVMPGNDGMRLSPKIKTLAIRVDDHDAVIAAVKDLDCQLVVVGPDDLLAAGIVDSLEKADVNVFGPRKEAARIEWSKSFAKGLMIDAGVPTARHALLRSEDAAALGQVAASLGGYPLVLKYDGLALGKGVRVCADELEAREFLGEVFGQKKFGCKGAASVPEVVAEEFLTGHEVSLFALCDGQTYALLEPACDYKRLLAANAGPNTGGMGAYSPVPWLAREFVVEMGERIFPPILKKLPFKGLLYAGLMVQNQDFRVLEFNARFGDPETQVILPRLASDLLPLLYSIAVGKEFRRYLDANPLRWSPKACVNVVLASRGYPEKPEVGHEIRFHSDFQSAPQFLYFAGVKSGETASVLRTSGGRVLSVSALGDGLEDARLNALAGVKSIEFEGMQFREDIGRVGPGY